MHGGDGIEILACESNGVKPIARRWVSMKTLRSGGTIFVVGAVILGLFSTAEFARSSDLAIGDQAPDFELPGSDGSTYRLADFRGKQVVVLAWFPKAFTGG